MIDKRITIVYKPQLDAADQTLTGDGLGYRRDYDDTGKMIGYRVFNREVTILVPLDAILRIEASL